MRGAWISKSQQLFGFRLILLVEMKRVFSINYDKHFQALAVYIPTLIMNSVALNRLSLFPSDLY